MKFKESGTIKKGMHGKIYDTDQPLDVNTIISIIKSYENDETIIFECRCSTFTESGNTVDYNYRNTLSLEGMHNYKNPSITLLNDEKDFDTLIQETEKVLPYIDNWAVCDQFVPKVHKKHTDELLVYIKKWLESDAEYTIRYGIKLLMSFYLDERFNPIYMDMVIGADRPEIKYVCMMTAWYFATALAKQYDAAIKVIEDNRLDRVTHNKAIQKAVESFRITDEQKEYLRTLRR